jgi:hypothetical protein
MRRRSGRWPLVRPFFAPHGGPKDRLLIEVYCVPWRERALNVIEDFGARLVIVDIN